MKKINPKYQRIIKKIKRLESPMRELRESDFAAKTALFKMRLKSGEILERILPEAFALVKEAARRRVGLEAHDVQLAGGIAAHEGNIVEMKTGEGKTLAIVFPAYLNALEGKGVHVITANDYLAERDAKWMGRIYQLLGVGADYITEKSSRFDRQVAYSLDITYASNSEICFDYLRDNMVYQKTDKCLRGFNFAIIDEADSVLIDEAQTPLVIADSAKAEDEEKTLFTKLNNLVKKLKKETDFKVDYDRQTIFLTIAGIKKIEKVVGVNNLYQPDPKNDYLYFIERLLKAHYLFKRDKDYIVDNGRIVIVDEFTGRLMTDHRYFQGIHQAIEAKEGLDIKGETETLAMTTFQHFFQRYQKVAGFTGTAQTAEKEFRIIYGKKVVVIPTHQPVIRQDYPDKFFLTWQDKVRYITWSTQEHFFKRRAVLIGTRSVRKSIQIQEALIEENIPSNVLNAKHTVREAEVIAQAGQPQTVTVATNMAGRGTDIELAGEVKEKGGLWVIGTERHNARRIDNQLIGRAGRQGDPGESQFLISADDELINPHFREKYIKTLKKHQAWHQGTESKQLEKIIKRAQSRMESLFFDQRILNFEFDKVLEKQRSSFYRQRERVLQDENLRKETSRLLKIEISREALKELAPKTKIISSSQAQKIFAQAQKIVNNQWIKFKLSASKKRFTMAELRKALKEGIEKYYNDFESYYGMEKTREMEKITTLKVLDLMWARHLKMVEQLQEAALIDSLGKNNFFSDYEIKMNQAYRRMLFSVPKVLCKTIIGTMNQLWKQ